MSDINTEDHGWVDETLDLMRENRAVIKECQAALADTEGTVYPWTMGRTNLIPHSSRDQHGEPMWIPPADKWSDSEIVAMQEKSRAKFGNAYRALADDPRYTPAGYDPRNHFGKYSMRTK